MRGNTASAATEPVPSDSRMSVLPANPSPMRKTHPALQSYRTKVGMISLGCAKNLVDAEIMLGSVLRSGMKITSRAEDANVLVVNTCAFIDSAKEESIEAILEAHQQRGLNKRPNQKLIVSGCMSQRFASDLRQLLPEVDAFIGLDQVSDLGEIVQKVLRQASHDGDVDLEFGRSRPTYIPDYDTPRFRLTPAHFAYVKVAEGCNHPCSFCVIPQMRGRHRRRRETSRAHIEQLIDKLRAGIPGVALRSTFIVGFPGETETEFETLLDFIKRTRFERLGIFKYSREEGSRAAKMPNQVPAGVKNARYRIAMSIQQQIAQDVVREKDGSEIKLLVDQPYVARSEADAPEVDARVILSKTAPVGEFIWRKIIGSRGYDLLA